MDCINRAIEDASSPVQLKPKQVDKLNFINLNCLDLECLNDRAFDSADCFTLCLSRGQLWNVGKGL